MIPLRKWKKPEKKESLFRKITTKCITTLKLNFKKRLKRTRDRISWETCLIKDGSGLVNKEPGPKTLKRVFQKISRNSTI